MKYRAVLQVMVLAFRDNHDAATPLSAGESFQLVGPDRDDRFVIIKARASEFLVFATDLEKLARPVSPKRTLSGALRASATSR